MSFYRQRDCSTPDPKYARPSQVQREQAMIKTLIYIALSFVVLTSPANVAYFMILFKPGFDQNENHLLVLKFLSFKYV